LRRRRTRQEVDDGRRGSGYVFGASQPATGEAFTRSDQGRTIANWRDVLDHVDAWAPVAHERIYAILDHRSTHRALDVLRWALTHPPWAFVFHPIHAADLNLIEPWGKIRRARAQRTALCELGRGAPSRGGRDRVRE
jgi:hypothetical protein